MTTRYDALTVTKYVTRDGEEKNYFTKIGTMWTNKKGDSFTLELIAYPIPDKEGKVRLLIKEPTERDGGYKRNEPAVAQKKISEAIDDDIPF